MDTNTKFKTVDQYIAQFPPATRKQLEDIRSLIRESAPDAEEGISYNMPAYKFHGVLVYFAGYENHIGFYPTNSGITRFTNEISRFKYSKGAVQFPLGKPIPKTLFKKIVKFRMKENLEKENLKKETRN